MINLYKRLISTDSAHVRNYRILQISSPLLHEIFLEMLEHTVHRHIHSVTDNIDIKTCQELTHHIKEDKVSMGLLIYRTLIYGCVALQLSLIHI